MLDAELVQGSPEWRQARAGSVGASEVADVVRRTKTGVSATRASLMARLLIERLTGRPADTYASKAMLDGLDREPMARAIYELMTDCTIERVGLVRHPGVTGAHASPDGLVGDRGLVEIKCPQPAAHLDTLLNNRVEADYQTQIQWQLAATGRQWCDYVSFCPDFPAHLQLYIARVERDPERIAELEAAVGRFLEDLDLLLARLAERYRLAA